MQIATLMRLAAADTASASQHLSKVYDWRYAEAQTVAKGFIATASALVIPLLLPLLQPSAKAPLSLGGVIVVLVSAGVLATFGIVRFASARRIHAEYLAAQTLLGHLRDMQPFLRLYEESRGE